MTVRRDAAVRVAAPAKLNLYLALTGHRDGYHELDTVMQEIDLHDTIEIEAADATEVIVEAGVPLPEHNTMTTAAALFYQAAGLPGGCRIRIWKAIPAAAGLGGGSSDGTAVLRGLNALHGGVLPEAALERLALKVGADCPFFLRGGTQRARGVGEKLTRAVNRCHFHFLLVKPEEGVSTSSAFSLADQLPPVQIDVQSCLEALAAGNEKAYFTAAGNALLPAAMQLVPELGRLGARCLELGGLFWQMSGSGSCLFAAYQDREQRSRAAEQLRNDSRLFVQPVETVE